MPLYASLINFPVVKRQMEMTSGPSLSWTKRHQLSPVNQWQDQRHKPTEMRAAKRGEQDISTAAY
jgi:hypothetical protein